MMNEREEGVVLGVGLAGRNKRREKEKEKIIPPRELKIAWAFDDSQWKIHPPSTNQKEGVAEAIKVMWLEVKATYNGAKAGRKYEIGFKISMKDDAFGWENCPLFFMVKVAGSYSWRKLIVDKTAREIEFPSNFQVEIPPDETDTALEFGLYEVWGGRWKGGLLIHHAFLRQL